MASGEESRMPPVALRTLPRCLSLPRRSPRSVRFGPPSLRRPAWPWPVSRAHRDAVAGRIVRVIETLLAASTRGWAGRVSRS